jgi:hypothetical protein
MVTVHAHSTKVLYTASPRVAWLCVVLTQVSSASG